MAGLLGHLGTHAAAKVVSGGIKRATGLSLGTHNVHMAGMTYSQVRQQTQQGYGMGGAFARAGVNAALYSSNPLMMTAIQAAPALTQGMRAAQDFRRARGEQLLDIQNNARTVGGGYLDTQQAQTMRQAAVQQIQGNKLNARSALGGEARLFSNRRFFDS